MNNHSKLFYEVVKKYDNIAEAAIKFYPFSHKSNIRLLNYSENATYLVKDLSTDQKYILRVCRPNYHTKSEIESELTWLKLIAAQEVVKAPLPVLGNNGIYIQDIWDQGQHYFCIMFNFLEGELLSEDNEKILIKHFENVGEITAKLHDHTINNRDYLGNITRFSWNYETILGPNPKWGRWQDGLGMTPERVELFEKVSEKIKTRLDHFGSGPDKFGLIHGDLRLANLLVDGQDKIKVIDFDDCGFSYYLFDLAASLSFIEHKPFVPELIEAWLKGYRKVRPLSKEEEQEISTFIMMRRLHLIAWIGSRDNETTRKMGIRYTEDTDILAKKYLQCTKIY
ncbi:phosphotransferase enzyme family protein [Calidifontibacillus erzurumensis]|uniref:Phosphotransferase n=1 Tax=Calidifontibacillus erzurumensis TaxID=2741433 RepID=A0A8J8GBM0_9BACI|nr:phosphotransferase [Calidifontibacillus erzurumensis]NSL50940.1 phosphotransferase [Calidifontibacillus erzurumensis]